MNILNWKLTGHIIGMLVMLEAVFLSVSTLVALRYNVWGEDHDLIAMLVTTGVCAVIGGMLLLSNRRYNNSKFSYREGFFIVTVTWLLFSVIGMLPYLIYGTFTSVTDAFIETVSGFTTTGCLSFLVWWHESVRCIQPCDDDTLVRRFFYASVEPWVLSLGLHRVRLLHLPVHYECELHIVLFPAKEAVATSMAQR